jgi:hypothetical protein
MSERVVVYEKENLDLMELSIISKSDSVRSISENPE